MEYIYGAMLLHSAGKKITEQNIKKVLDLEKELYKENTYNRFGKAVLLHRFTLKKLLMKLIQENKTIVGIGAPAKGNTLLNYCNITPDILSYIAEYSSLKIGKYSPGKHIPVVDESRLIEDQPEYALFLVWNLADRVIPKLREKGYKGKFIIPLPEVMVVEDGF